MNRKSICFGGRKPKFRHKICIIFEKEYARYERIRIYEITEMNGLESGVNIEEYTLFNKLTDASEFSIQYKNLYR